MCIKTSELFSGYSKGGDYSIKADTQVVDYLINNTSKNDFLFIWGFEPSIYYLSKIKPATRFIYNFVLFPLYNTGPFKDLFISDIVKSEPKVIMVLKNDLMPWVTGSMLDSKDSISSFIFFKILLKNKYHLVKNIEDFEVYFRN